ncbi:MAG TPA: DinB family protein, partial [Syntrophobacteria bacterium]|nr:DinB family protein [Syntrophobacteria bacterium]
PTERVEALIAKLDKGLIKTEEILSSLTAEQWNRILYDGPPTWTVRDLLAHLVSGEGRLLDIARDVAAGGEGAPPGFDLDAFNAEEKTRLAAGSPAELLPALAKARQVTLDWVRTLDDSQLDCLGRHPALGEVTLEAMITAIYGHQLLHMRDLKSKF